MSLVLVFRTEHSILEPGCFGPEVKRWGVTY